MSDFWKNHTVLVTGAGGFIGSHLVERLSREGVRVRAFVRYNSRGDPGMLRLSSAQTLARVEIVAGDLQDSAAVRNAVEGCQVVFHLGALISIPYSYHHPQEVVETNVMGTLNVLAACREFKVRRLVHTSSSEVFGTALKAPIDEGHPLQGQSPYSASKIAADKLAESYFCTYGLPVVTVRPFNTYGPRQSGRAVIPTIISQALANGTIYLGALDPTRDFTYVEDSVGGFLKAGEAVGVEGMAFNLGTGSEVRIGDLAQKIIHMLGRPVKIVVDPLRLRPDRSEVLRLVSDNRLAGERLGWKPGVDLEEGLGRTIAWVQEHPEFYRVGSYEL